jgi:5-methylcytosine-specific restriction endonuclease McrA
MDGTAVVDRKTLPSTAACSLAYGPNSDGRCEWDGRPLPPLRVEFCSTACEHAFREAHEWPLARVEARARAAGRCQVCAARPIEIHHVEPVDDYGPGCQHHASNLAGLCRTHHAEAHRRLRAKPGTQLDLFRAA